MGLLISSNITSIFIIRRWTFDIRRSTLTTVCDSIKVPLITRHASMWQRHTMKVLLNNFHTICHLNQDQWLPLYLNLLSYKWYVIVWKCITYNIRKTYAWFIWIADNHNTIDTSWTYHWSYETNNHSLDFIPYYIIPYCLITLLPYYPITLLPHHINERLFNNY